MGTYFFVSYNDTLFTSGKLFYMWFEFATKNSPISGCCGSRQLLTTLLFKIFKGTSGFSLNIFLKWVQKSSFLTSITYSLTPSTSNLINAIATASKQLFTRRPLHF